MEHYLANLSAKLNLVLFRMDNSQKQLRSLAHLVLQPVVASDLQTHAHAQREAYRGR